MNHRLFGLVRLASIIPAALAFVVPWTAWAQPAPGDLPGMYCGPMPAHGGGFGGPLPPGRNADMPWRGPGFIGPEEALPPLPILRGLTLTEAQRDKVFAILYAQMPALRENAKSAQHAQDDLQRMVTSGNYDNAKAKALADSGASAMAHIDLMRAEGEHQIYLILTDAQKEQLDTTRQVGHQK